MAIKNTNNGSIVRFIDPSIKNYENLILEYIKRNPNCFWYIKPNNYSKKLLFKLLNMDFLSMETIMIIIKNLT